ncbi:rCG23147, partial [Rattus norvegicus]
FSSPSPTTTTSSLSRFSPSAAPPSGPVSCSSTATKERPEGAARLGVAGTWGFLPTHPWPPARDQNRLRLQTESPHLIFIAFRVAERTSRSERTDSLERRPRSKRLTSGWTLAGAYPEPEC